MRIYVHLPFCRSKCWYCSFNSQSGKDGLFESYAQALLRQVDFFKKAYPFNSIESLYIGGGTPSFFPVNYISKVVNALFKGAKLSSDFEFTIEANPIDVSKEWLNSVKALGVNRISLGAQSFNDDILRFLGRLHDAKQAINAVKTSRSVFGNMVSVDIIYGVPGQDRSQMEKDFSIACELEVSHISAYLLSLEDDTALARRGVKINVEKQALFYRLADELLSGCGFEWYEISNYARREDYCRHNLGYWNGDEFLGIGAGAWSFAEAERFAWAQDIEAYIEKRGFDPDFCYKVDDVQREIALLQLRTKFGANCSIIAKTPHQEDYLNMLINEGFMEKQKGNCRLTLKGRLFADEISGNLL